MIRIRNIFRATAPASLLLELLDLLLKVMNIVLLGPDCRFPPILGIFTPLILQATCIAFWQLAAAFHLSLRCKSTQSSSCKLVPDLFLTATLTSGASTSFGLGHTDVAFRSHKPGLLR